MEEDIKMLEEYKEKMIKDEKIHDDYRNMLTAIENLINRNKQLEADNYEQNNIINNYIEIEKEHQKENGKLRERIKELEEKYKWKSISEYDNAKYDWVLVKYYDRDYECVPEVAEKRSDGKWYTDEKEIPFEVKYFFDMQELLGDDN